MPWDPSEAEPSRPVAEAVRLASQQQQTCALPETSGTGRGSRLEMSLSSRLPPLGRERSRARASSTPARVGTGIGRSAGVGLRSGRAFLRHSLLHSSVTQLEQANEA